MTPVEKLEAAIKKLEAERDAAPKGPWVNEYGDLDGADHKPVCDMEVQCGSYCQGGIAPGLSDGSSNLIVTLHRTIDAQLAVLGHCLNNPAEGTPGLRWQTSDHPALALATAILGGA